MSSLLSTIYFKRGRLTIDDLIKVAVSTTPPPYQEEALRVASKIVYGSKEAKPKSAPHIPIPPLALPFMLLSIPLGLFKLANKWFNFGKSLRWKGASHRRNRETKRFNGGMSKTVSQKAVAQKSEIREVEVKGRVTSPNTDARKSRKLALKKHPIKSRRPSLRSFKSLFTSLKHSNAESRKSKRSLIERKGVRRDKSSLPSLDAGPGENLLRDWYELRDALPRRAREEMKEIVKEVLTEWVDVRAKSLIGTNRVGVLPSHVVKPCDSHDLLEYVDLEETIENLLSKCKRLTEITYEDLMVRVPERGNNSIVLLLDASGSMAGEKLVTMATSTIMILKVFSKDEIALAVFESDIFRVKEIDERVELDEIVDMLLDLEPLGGTCVSRALLWAEEQFEKSLSNTKILVLLSDLAFYDYREAEFVLRRMIENDVRVFVLVPKLSYNVIVASFLKKLGAIIIEAKSWREAISLLLERIYPCK